MCILFNPTKYSNKSLDRYGIQIKYEKKTKIEPSFKRASDIGAICDKEFIMRCVHRCAWEGIGC